MADQNKTNMAKLLSEKKAEVEKEAKEAEKKTAPKSEAKMEEKAAAKATEKNEEKAVAKVTDKIEEKAAGKEVKKAAAKQDVKSVKKETKDTKKAAAKQDAKPVKKETKDTKKAAAKKDTKKETKKPATSYLFFGAFLKAVVILLIFVILGMGAYLTKNLIQIYKNGVTTEIDESVFSNDNQVDDLLMATPDEADTEETVEEASSDEAEEDQGITTPVVVLNGTNTPGIAGYYQQKIQDLGYSNVTAANYQPVDGATSANTKIYVSAEGMGEDMKVLFADPTYITGKIDSSTAIDNDGNPLDLSKTDIIIVVGESDQAMQ
ncbi:MAG: LytR C-terminal domain-containing protein [Lachnospiraceae bacterium]|nr:LytR C-terminal domain-containing protein [Lachnospiraceae bacterium]